MDSDTWVQAHAIPTVGLNQSTSVLVLSQPLTKQWCPYSGWLRDYTDGMSKACHAKTDMNNIPKGYTHPVQDTEPIPEEQMRDLVSSLCYSHYNKTLISTSTVGIESDSRQRIRNLLSKNNTWSLVGFVLFLLQQDPHQHVNGGYRIRSKNNARSRCEFTTTAPDQNVRVGIESDETIIKDIPNLFPIQNLVSNLGFGSR